LPFAEDTAAATLPLLDVGMIRRTPKLFIGYSDNTSPSVADVPVRDRCTSRSDARRVPGEGHDAHDEASFVGLMQNGAGLALSPDGVGVVRGGEATGPLFGGTMTC
jgi:hypothetical protein